MIIVGKTLLTFARRLVRTIRVADDAKAGTQRPIGAMFMRVFQTFLLLHVQLGDAHKDTLRLAISVY